MQFRGNPIGHAATVAFAVIGSLEMLSGVVGNVLLLSVLFTSRLLSQASHHNFFIANLALADLLTLGYWMPFLVLDLILGYTPVVNQAHCEFNGFVICLCTIVSILTLVSISLDRFLHVCHSRLYRRVFNRTATIACCLLLWVTGAAVTVPPFFAHGALGSYYYKKETHACGYTSDTYPRVVTVILMVGSTLSIVYFNLAIFCFWRRAKLKLRTSGMAVPRQTCCPCGPRERVSSRDTETEGVDGPTETSPDTESNAPTASHTADTESNAPTVSLMVDMSSSKPSTEDAETHGPAQADEQGRDPPNPMATDNVPATMSSASETQPHQGMRGDVITWCPESSLLRETRETDPVGGTARYENKPKKGSCRRARKTFRQQQARRRRKWQNRERAFVRSLAVISLLMAICILPFGVSEAFHPLPGEVSLILTLLLFVNNSVNWAVYGIMNRPFREEYAKMIRRIVPKCPQNQDQTPATVSLNA